MCKFPKATFKMPSVSEPDGNVHVIIGRVRALIKAYGGCDVDVEDFTKEATSGDYDNARETCKRWVNVI